MKPDNVLDTFWPRMTADKIVARSIYHDGVQERVELKEILTEIISMTH